jgi:hypothetical protein
VAVPDAGLHPVANRLREPPVRFTASWVSGISGSPVNVAEFVSSETEPTSVSGNGAGNVSVRLSPPLSPVR